MILLGYVLDVPILAQGIRCARRWKGIQVELVPESSTYQTVLRGQFVCGLE